MSTSLEPLAIVGLSLRLPQDATTAESFWKMLEQKRCAMTEIPARRMDINAYYHPADRVDTVRTTLEAHATVPLIFVS
jgi:acyl transferase domain-containing protein